MKEKLLQMIFPRRCPVCDGIVVPYGEKICAGCLPKLQLITPPWCMKCGKKLFSEGDLCEDCRNRKHNFVRGRALYEYGQVAPAVYRLKYGGRQEYADFFGEELVRYLGEFIDWVKPEGLVPIPLHPRRQNRRGYNQAQLLANAVGRCTGIPVYHNLLIRVKNTAPLKRQNVAERQNNLKKAFNIMQNDVKLNTIILIDDIYTTGSTMDAAAAVLQEHGVRNIYFVALACGAGI